MKTKKLAVTAFIAFVAATAVAIGLNALIRPSEPARDEPPALVVYYFYEEAKCDKCKKIEQYSREVLEQAFAAQLKNGQIVWKEVNYTLPENRRLVDDYKVLTTAIVIADFRPGHKRVVKNHQQRVWELVDDKEAFGNFLRGEIEQSLK